MLEYKIEKDYVLRYRYTTDETANDSQLSEMSKWPDFKVDILDNNNIMYSWSEPDVKKYKSIKSRKRYWKFKLPIEDVSKTITG